MFAVLARRGGNARILQMAVASALTGIALLLAAAAAAEEFKAGDLAIADVWARPSIGTTGNSAAYMTITNGGGQADKLIAANTDVAKTVELHTHIRDGDIMRMRRVEGGIDVAAGKTTAFKPGGLHVMLIGLQRKLVDGDSFPMTLSFEKAGDVAVTVKVRKGMAHQHGKH